MTRFFSSLVVANSSVFVRSDDGGIHADDVDTEQQWILETGDLIRSSPVVADGLFPCGGWDNNLYAVNANTGIERWKFETDGRIISTRKVTGEKIIFGSNDTNIYTLNASESIHENGDHSDRTNKISSDVDSFIDTLR
jgi:outer membrane protein assembly factor BamB